MMFFFFVQIISSYSLIVVVASSEFPTLLACSFKSSLSTFSLLINESINCFQISFSLTLFVLVALRGPPFLGYEQKIAIRL